MKEKQSEERIFRMWEQLTRSNNVEFMLEGTGSGIMGRGS